MNDTDLKKNLEDIRHRAIGIHLELDEIRVFSACFKQTNLKTLNKKLTALSQSMLEIEDVFDENIQIPSTFNSAVMRAAQISILFSLRSSTGNAIRDARQTLDHIYNDINFYRALTISLTALIVSVIGIF